MHSLQQGNWQALQHVPETVQLAHPDICMAAVQQNGGALYKVSEAVKLANPEICMAAVQQDWRALRQVSEAVQLAHPDIPLAAVKQAWLALEFVPKDVQLNNPDICMAAIAKNDWALQYVPKDVQRANPHICLAAVQQCGRALLYVPTDVQQARPDIPLAAVKQASWALQYVPEAVQLANPDIPLAAVKKYDRPLIDVPESLKTNVEALAKLHTNSQEQLIIDLKLLRVKNKIICRVLQKYITTESKNESVVYHPAPYLYDIKQPGWAPTASNMTEEVQRELPEISRAAVAQNGLALRYVPTDLRDEKMCMAAVKQKWEALYSVPEDVQLANPDIPLAAVAQNGLALLYVPTDVQLTHPEIYMTAIAQNRLALRYVAASLKTNVDALAKLYTNSQEQLIIDLKLLRVKNEIICRVLSHLSFNIARELLQNNINSDVLGVLQEHITTESKDEGVVYHPAPYLYDIKQPGWAPTASNMTAEVAASAPRDL
jgi:hypothetical protein